MQPIMSLLSNSHPVILRNKFLIVGVNNRAGFEPAK